jgi:S-adenosylmethionine:tRNA ribosyltransferase-isomerase
VQSQKPIDIEHYSYTLPDDRIAKYPLPDRDASKMLIYRQGKISKARFSELPSFLPSPADLFLNNTRVIHARLIFHRPTGSRIEIFCLAPHDPGDYQLAFTSKDKCIWRCMVGNLKKWKENKLEMTASTPAGPFLLTAEKIEIETNSVLVCFSWNNKLTFGQVIEQYGIIPIPPYLERESENIDNDRYQTFYSRTDGSVAAPTAGLHFTPEVFTELNNRDISINEITLHVGAGTFQPVKEKNARRHAMHNEFISIERSVIEQLSNTKLPVIATGTTTLRTIESLYWLGVKSIQTKKICTTLDQWEYNSLPTDLPTTEVFSALNERLKEEGIQRFIASTNIMIIPGYEFRVVKTLITNFHQPKSTLLLLIAAFIGEDWKKVYMFALENEFRFLSYGDSSLLMI